MGVIGMGKRSHIKKGDTVYVLAGKDYQHRLEALSSEERGKLAPQTAKREVDKHPGRRGKVLQVVAPTCRVIVDGINMVTKHARPRGQTTRAAQMQTGRIQQPAPIHLSNVMLVCPRCDQPTKVTYQVVGGKRVRVCKRCREYVDEV